MSEFIYHNFNIPVVPYWKYKPGDTVWICRSMKIIRATVKARPSGLCIDKCNGEYELTFEGATSREWETEVKMFRTRKECIEHYVEWLKQTVKHDKERIKMAQYDLQEHTKHLGRLQKALEKYK